MSEVFPVRAYPFSERQQNNFDRDAFPEYILYPEKPTHIAQNKIHTSSFNARMCQIVYW